MRARFHFSASTTALAVALAFTLGSVQLRAAYAIPPPPGVVATPIQPVVRATPVLNPTAAPSVVDVALAFDPAALAQLGTRFTPAGVCRTLQSQLSTTGLTTDPYFERITPLSLEAGTRTPRCIGTYTMKPNAAGRYASITSLRVLDCFLTSTFPPIAVTPNLSSSGANSVAIDPLTHVPTIEQTITATNEGVAGAWTVPNCGYAF